jgi:hypothetical protein
VARDAANATSTGYFVSVSVAGQQTFTDRPIVGFIAAYAAVISWFASMGLITPDAGEINAAKQRGCSMPS